uniref:Endonuclease/exonuclease/phosphatase domain-containing protein n=1 Tax=Homalodisca liturata TaxID=320908 RepID=A0A1B6HRM3_9HEMI
MCGQLANYTLINAFCKENILKEKLLSTNKVSYRLKYRQESLNTEMICEVSAVKITLNKKENHVLGIYRPPTAAIDQAITIITDVLGKINPQNSDILITGDINVKNLIGSRDRRAFSEILASYNVSKIELPKTRITANSAMSIDIVCTNIDTAGVSVKILKTEISDYTGQYSNLYINDT